MRIKINHLVIVILVLLSSIAVLPARAATFSVCTLTDLTTAITTANSNGQADVINFSCSTTLIFTAEMTILSDGGNSITINANNFTVVFDEVGDDNWFFAVSGGASLILNNLTLQNGDQTSGGAISNSSGTLTINNSTFINNRAASNGAGGAIYNVGTLNITNSTFTGNSAGIAGAIYTYSSTATITNSTFTGNSAGNGGAIYHDTSVNNTMTITNSTFTGNSAISSGGAIWNERTMTIINSTFKNNTAVSGGALMGFYPISTQDSYYENNTCSALITDGGGNTVNNASGCPGTAPSALSVSALACVGNNAVFTINAGDTNFNITGTGAGLPLSNSPIGLTTLTGPATWTNITITERRGNRQSINLGGITCPGSIVIAPSEPTVTVLGCALDASDGVEVAGVPDNTYCRVLMRNGGVVSYSGAIPADLIGLGVILAVDVYRLEGGATVNTFPNYSRVCLSGSGRLFYMDSRQAPRVVVELATETEGSLTCGWIPAPGTLILTH